jgi:hypothetical protein
MTPCASRLTYIRVRCGGCRVPMLHKLVLYWLSRRRHAPSRQRTTCTPLPQYVQWRSLVVHADRLAGACEGHSAVFAATDAHVQPYVAPGWSPIVQEQHDVASTRHADWARFASQTPSALLLGAPAGHVGSGRGLPPSTPGDVGSDGEEGVELEGAPDGLPLSTEPPHPARRRRGPNSAPIRDLRFVIAPRVSTCRAAGVKGSFGRENGRNTEPRPCSDNPTLAQVCTRSP